MGGAAYAAARLSQKTQPKFPRNGFMKFENENFKKARKKKQEKKRKNSYYLTHSTTTHTCFPTIIFLSFSLRTNIFGTAFEADTEAPLWSVVRCARNRLEGGSRPYQPYLPYFSQAERTTSMKTQMKWCLTPLLQCTQNIRQSNKSYHHAFHCVQSANNNTLI